MGLCQGVWRFEGGSVPNLVFLRIGGERDLALSAYDSESCEEVFLGAKDTLDGERV